MMFKGVIFIKQIDMEEEIKILEENAREALNVAIMYAEMTGTKLCLLNIEKAEIIMQMLQERNLEGA